MALTPSTMLELGTPAAPFELANHNPLYPQQKVALNDYQAPALLIAFICNHCPYVVHMKSALVDFHQRFHSQGMDMIAINSNDVANYPADSPEKMAEDAKQFNYPFAYLFDADQQVAKAYDAACTPDFYLFDEQRKLVYRGQFDESRPGNGKPVDGADLAAAVSALLAGEPLTQTQIPSMGCNIKWR